MEQMLKQVSMFRDNHSSFTTEKFKSINKLCSSAEDIIWTIMKSKLAQLADFCKFSSLSLKWPSYLLSILCKLYWILSWNTAYGKSASLVQSAVKQIIAKKITHKIPSAVIHRIITTFFYTVISASLTDLHFAESLRLCFKWCTNT